MLYNVCQICGRQKLEHYISVSNFDIYLCGHCHTFLNGNFKPKGKKLQPNKFGFWLNTNEKEIFNQIEGTKRLFDYLMKHSCNQETNYFLDFGCGRGYLAMIAAINGFKNVYVSDFYENIFCKYREIIAQKYPEVGSITFIKGYPQKITFNHIILWHVLEHTINPIPFIQRITKLAKKCCNIAIQTPEMTYKDIIPSHKYFFSEKSFYYIAKKTGIKINFVDHDVTNSFMTTICHVESEQININDEINKAFESVKCSPKAINKRIILIDLLQKNRQYKKTINECEKLLAIETDNLYAYKCLENMYNYYGKFSKSIHYSRLTNNVGFFIEEPEITNELKKLMLKIESHHPDNHIFMDKIIEYILSSIDLVFLSELQQKFPKYKDAKNEEKYLNHLEYIKKNVKICILLELHKIPSKRILDIGAGFGWFSYLCTLLGHDVTALDMQGAHPLFDDSIKMLGIKRIKYTILPFCPLPVFPEKFDLITCNQIMFNTMTGLFEWGPHEWTYFLYDLSSRLCNDYYEIFIEWNKHKNDRHHGHKFSEIMRQYMIEHDFIFNNDYAFYNKRGTSPLRQWILNFYHKNKII